MHMYTIFSGWEKKGDGNLLGNADAPQNHKSTVAVVGRPQAYYTLRSPRHAVLADSAYRYY